VIVHGTVPDMRPYFRRATLVVVPLLHGGGTRLKILEAGASGKAIVSTSVGAEGLAFRPGHDLVLADTPEEFADAVTRLCRDGRQRAHLGRNARAASLRYEWKRLGESLCRIVERFSRDE
jgi:glycosyltransferase involved in cell wall biosynthesis